MSKLSTEAYPSYFKTEKERADYLTGNIDPLLSLYFMEVNESKLTAVALLLISDELPSDPILNSLFSLLQREKQQDPRFYRLAKHCIYNSIENVTLSTKNRIKHPDNDLKPYEVMVLIHLSNDTNDSPYFVISKQSLNMLSLAQAKAIGLALTQKSELIVRGSEVLTLEGGMALEKIVFYSKIKRLRYLSYQNDIMPQHEVFETLLSHLTWLGLYQFLLLSFTPHDWQLFGEALSKSKVKTLYLSAGPVPILSVLDPEQLEELTYALSGGPVTELDLSGFMANVISEGEGLRKITIQKCNELGKAISQSTVTSLNLSGNELGHCKDLKWEALLTAVLSENNITHLNLSLNLLEKLSTKSWEIFAKILSQSKVTHLNLSGNNLTLATIPRLVCKNVTDLNLDNNNLHALPIFDWQNFWVNFLSGSKVIRLDVGNLDFNKLSTEQWQIFCDVIRDSNVRVVTMKKSAVVSVLHEQRSKELTLALANKKGTLEGLIRHTLWNVYQMKVERADPNSDNNNAPLLVRLEKDGQPYETIVEADDSKVLGEASDYPTPLRYV